MSVKTVEHKASKGQPMTIDELDAFVQDARRSGANGSEVPKVTATWGGKIGKLAVDVEVAVGVPLDKP